MKDDDSGIELGPDDVSKRDAVREIMQKFSLILAKVIRTEAEMAVEDEDKNPALVTQALYGALAYELGYTDGLAEMLGVPSEGRDDFRDMMFEEGKKNLLEAMQRSFKSSSLPN